MTVTTANTGVYQDVTGLVPGMFYQFNAWVRSESGWTMAALTASNPDGSNLASSGTQSIYTNWQALSVTFRPNSQGTARIRLVKMDTADALYWDDVELPPYLGPCTKGTRLRYYPYGQEIGTVDGERYGEVRDVYAGFGGGPGLRHEPVLHEHVGKVHDGGSVSGERRADRSGELEPVQLRAGGSGELC